MRIAIPVKMYPDFSKNSQLAHAKLRLPLVWQLHSQKITSALSMLHGRATGAVQDFPCGARQSILEKESLSPVLSTPFTGAQAARWRRKQTGMEWRGVRNEGEGTQR